MRANTVRKRALLCGLLAAALGILIMLPAMIQFGGFFAIRGDYITQHITRTITARRMFLGGKLPQWDWTSFLGTEYSYWRIFLSFDNICFLFPESWVPYILTLTNAARFFVMGLTSFMLIRRFVRREEYAVLGALLYTFSSYTIVTLEFMLFLDDAALFPLLLLGLEKRFTDKKYRFLFILAVFLNGLCWAYLFIGTSLAMLVYALIRLFTAEEWRERRKPKYVLLCFAEYAIGVLLCGFFFAVFAKSMLTTSRSAAMLSQGTSLKTLLIPKHFFDALAGLFLPAASNRVTSFFSHTPWYSMHACLPVLGAIPAVAAIAKKRLKDGLRIILAAYFVISVMPLLNGASSFYANGYTRWWYAFALVLAVVSARVLDRREEYGERAINVGIAVQWAAILLAPAVFYAVKALHGTELSGIKSFIAIFFYHDYSNGFAEDIFRIFTLVFAALFAAAATALLKSKRRHKLMLPVICVFIVLYGAGFVALNNCEDVRLSGVFVQSSVPLKDIVYEYYKAEKPKAQHPYSWRIDAPYLLPNYAVVANLPSISSHESTFDSDAMRFAEYAKMGSADSVYLVPSDGGNALRTLLSVKYYYDYSEGAPYANVPAGFTYSHNEAGTDIYINDNYLPFGFAYDSYITESELEAYAGADVGTLLHTLVVEDGDAAFAARLLEHCASPASDLPADAASRARCTSLDFSADTSGFTASFINQKDELIFFSVPYDEGWHAYLDGEPASFIRANLGFMALPVPTGEHTVAFRYNNPALLPGVILSAAGALAFAAYASLTLAREKRRDTSK